MSAITFNTTWRRYTEPWYLAYALIGIVAAGILPILLPQYIESVRSSGEVGVVLAAFNLGGFTSILWGRLVEEGRERGLVVLSLIVFTLALLLILIDRSILLITLMVFVLGSSLNALTTAASVSIMRRFDKSEWDQRISWMMVSFQMGQVVGLLVVSYLIQLVPQTSFYVSTGFALVAFLLVLQSMRPSLSRNLLHFKVSRSPVHCHTAHLPIPSGLPHFHLGLVDREHIVHIFRTRFGLLILGNVLQVIAAAFVFTLFPLLYLKTFGVDPGVSALLYGAASVLTIILFPYSGQLAHRVGSVNVVRAALAIRCLCCLCLLLLVLLDLPGKALLASLLFAIIVCAWPFIGVGFTLAIPEVATLHEGAAVGLFNASTAAANTIGAILAGLAVAVAGYDSLPLFAFVVMAMAVGGLLRLSRLATQ
jgi:predicted MFS family arabinose efflux permease